MQLQRSLHIRLQQHIAQILLLQLHPVLHAYRIVRRHRKFLMIRVILRHRRPDDRHIPEIRPLQCLSENRLHTLYRKRLFSIIIPDDIGSDTYLPALHCRQSNGHG